MAAVETRRALRLALFVCMFVVVPSAFASTIMGTVTDGRSNGLSSVNVELLNSYHVMIQHTMTDGVGRYTFEGLSDGNYEVKVMPFRYDLEEQIREVTIATISVLGGGFTNEVVDFVLVPRKGTMAAAQASVVVAQEIPPEAKKAYEDGVKIFKTGKTDMAIPLFQQAIKAFPDYFLANNALGALYFDKHDYEHAAPPLMKAAGVYDRSPMTLYQLGVTLTKLNYAPAAIVALKAAAILAPASPAIFTALGAAQRQNHDYAGAEKSLLQAKKVMKADSAEVYKELAALYGEMKQYNKGVEKLEQMLKAG